MKCVEEVLCGQGGNYILPFLWLHGEEQERILEEMDSIEKCGIRAFCVESRPHPAFGEALWWEQLGMILEEARKRNMEVWVLDDKHFPTGYAKGEYERQPEKAKVYLREFHMDLCGPAKQNTVFIEHGLKEPEEILTVWLYRRQDRETSRIILEGARNLTPLYQDGMVQLDVEEGEYRLFVLYTSRSGGGREHYMNLLDEESVRVLIDAVYEPHYEHFGQYFGETLAGFFSDEPELGNVPGYEYDMLPGREKAVYPWSASLGESLKECWGTDYTRFLPALWFEMGEKTPALRYDYMDRMTEQVRRCFSEQIGGWCREKGVQYIGHIIEDNNAHGRMGCSVGHYFRALAGQDMAGVDVVSQQLMPGKKERIHCWVDGEEDGEFYHFGLAKLGSSGAAVDPKKKGQALCELFGAYGWGEDVPLMKWILDHMLVRGINQFVPHAFSPLYPDPDCPPHFSAGGKNPQFPYFSRLMRYVNRSAHLLQNGHRWTEAAVLYHAEAEWTGTGAMMFQKPVRELLENQMDCNILPADVLGQAEIREGMFYLNGYGYSAFILPWCRRIPKEVEDFILHAGRAGVPVFAVDEMPECGIHGEALSDEIRVYMRAVPLQELAGEVRRVSRCSFSLADSKPDLRAMRYLHEDGSVCMFFNESTEEVVRTEVRIPGMEKNGWVRYRPFENELEELPGLGEALNRPAAQGRKSDVVLLNLQPGEAVFLVEAEVERAEEDRPVNKKGEIWENPIQTAWTVSRAEVGGEFTTCFVLEEGEPFPNLNGREYYPSFSGTFSYDGSFRLDLETDSAEAVIDFPSISSCASIRINGKPAGDLMENGRFVDVSGLIHRGENRIRVEVSNTLVWKLRDKKSARMQIKPTGIMETPVLKIRKPSMLERLES